MQKLIDQFEKYLDTLSKRDQMAFFIILFVVITFTWDALLRMPLAEDMMVVKHDIVQAETEFVIWQSKIKALQVNMGEDPDNENREQLARYIEENKRLDKALEKTSIQIISPHEMAGFLEQMLKSQANLKFVSLKNMPAIPEFSESGVKGTSGVDSVDTIYRHSVILQMEGSYHNVLSYLKKLEQFPWKFFWQDIEIETGKYPNTMITLEVYTLGFREGIIGV